MTGFAALNQQVRHLDLFDFGPSCSNLSYIRVVNGTGNKKKKGRERGKEKKKGRKEGRKKEREK